VLELLLDVEKAEYLDLGVGAERDGTEVIFLTGLFLLLVWVDLVVPGAQRGEGQWVEHFDEAAKARHDQAARGVVLQIRYLLLRRLDSSQLAHLEAILMVKLKYHYLVAENFWFGLLGCLNGQEHEQPLADFVEACFNARDYKLSVYPMRRHLLKGFPIA
jgi:hypothetical protein